MNAQLVALLQELRDRGFWGKLTITFRQGKPTMICQEQQIKIDP